MKKQEAIEKLESRAFDVEDTDLVVGLRFAQNTSNKLTNPRRQLFHNLLQTGMKQIKMVLNITYTVFVSIFMNENYMKIYMNGSLITKINLLKY